MHIYVGNLSLKTTDADLKLLFEEYGKVDSANVYRDRFRQDTEALGFVYMPDTNDSKTAISNLDGKSVNGKTIEVHPARVSEEDRRNKIENIEADRRKDKDRRKK